MHRALERSLGRTTIKHRWRKFLSCPTVLLFLVLPLPLLQPKQILGKVTTSSYSGSCREISPTLPGVFLSSTLVPGLSGRQSQFSSPELRGGTAAPFLHKQAYSDFLAALILSGPPLPVFFIPSDRSTILLYTVWGTAGRENGTSSLVSDWPLSFPRVLLPYSPPEITQPFGLFCLCSIPLLTALLSPKRRGNCRWHPFGQEAYNASSPGTVAPKIAQTFGALQCVVTAAQICTLCGPLLAALLRLPSVSLLLSWSWCCVSEIGRVMEMGEELRGG